MTAWPVVPKLTYTLVSLGELKIQPTIVPSCNLIVLDEAWPLRFLFLGGEASGGGSNLGPCAC